MKHVDRVETLDGNLHLTVADAKRHAAARYADALSKLAHGITRLDFRYSAVMEFVDANLHEFEAALRLRKDIELEPTEHEDP